MTRESERPRAGRMDAASWVLAATILGSSMAFIDNSVVGVALPVVQQALRATVSAAQWVAELNTLLLGTLILLGGSLGDVLGRRRVFSWGVGLLAAGSLWAALVPSMGQLIAARGVSGIGSALLVPNSLALIGATFDGPARGRAVGTWSGLTSAVSALAPVLAGWLTEEVSWRAVFAINLPLAAAVLGIAWLRMTRDTAAEERHTLDLPGAALATLGLGGLVFGLIEGPVRGWGAGVVIGALVAGVVFLVLFILREGRAAAPMVPLGLFRSRTFSGVNLLTVLLYGALYTALFYVPFNMIQVQGYTATAAGAAFLPVTVLLIVLSRWAGGLSERIGPRLLLTVGPLLAALGMALFAAPGVGGSYWTTFFPPAVILGLGMGLLVAPLTSTVLGSVRREHTGVASGVNNTASRVGGLVAIAALGILLTQTFAARLDERLAAVDAPAEAKEAVAAQWRDLAAAQPPEDLPEETRAALQGAIAESYVDGFRLAMLACGAMGLLGTLAAWVLVEDKPDGSAGAG
jgi:EmrB/QacA subfamily drug resistance transporter